MGMKIFLIDIRSESNEEEYKMCSDILMDYFNKYHFDVFILKENKHRVNPSWLKLKCFDYVDDDFILCWDMDLLPKKDCPSIYNSLNFNKINLAVDSSVILKNQKLFIPSFKYNCGLMGIPRVYKNVMDIIFMSNTDSNWPSYEQYHINEFLAKRNFVDVHELDKTWNCLFHLPTISHQYIVSAKSVHFSQPDASIRKELIRKYHELYFKKPPVVPS